MKPQKMARYKQFGTIIRQVRPATIVEIGVHRGNRAALMIEEALKHAKHVTYTGYDIFEGGDEEFQAAALCAKGPPDQRQARWRLEKTRWLYGAGRVDWSLVVGDTRQTLAGQQIVADLVFIDGDHRVEAIRSDYEAVRGSRCVVFDDYYLPGSTNMPDLAVYGANRIVDEIPGAVILPDVDWSKAGGQVAFAMVLR